MAKQREYAKKVKARREARRAESKGKISKAVKQVSGDIKSAAKGSKEYQEAKAKKKVAKTAKVAKRKSAQAGPKKDLWYDVVKPAGKRVAKDVKSAAKGSKEYQAGKASRKASKAERIRKRTEKFEARKAERKKRSAKRVSTKAIKGSVYKVGKYQAGGKVESSGGESNPYGWPTKDARGGKK